MSATTIRFNAAQFALEMVTEMPPATWNQHVSELSPEERQQVTVALSDLVQTAALARGYFDGRYLYSERGHAAGVKNANSLRTKIRKALGFAYPKQDINF